MRLCVILSFITRYYLLCTMRLSVILSFVTRYSLLCTMRLCATLSFVMRYSPLRRRASPATSIYSLAFPYTHFFLLCVKYKCFTSPLRVNLRIEPLSIQTASLAQLPRQYQPRPPWLLQTLASRIPAPPSAAKTLSLKNLHTSIFFFLLLLVVVVLVLLANLSPRDSKNLGGVEELLVKSEVMADARRRFGDKPEGKGPSSRVKYRPFLFVGALGGGGLRGHL